MNMTPFYVIAGVVVALWLTKLIATAQDKRLRAEFDKLKAQTKRNIERDDLDNVPMFYEDGNFTAPVADKVTVIKVVNKSRAKKVEVRHG